MTTKINIFEVSTGKADGVEEISPKRFSRAAKNDFGHAMSNALSAATPRANQPKTPSHHKSSALHCDEKEEKEVSAPDQDDDRKKAAPRDENASLNSLLALLAQPATLVNPTPITSTEGNAANETEVVEAADGKLAGQKTDDEVVKEPTQQASEKNNISDKSGSSLKSSNDQPAKLEIEGEVAFLQTESADDSDKPGSDQISSAPHRTADSKEKAAIAVQPTDGKASAKQEEQMKFSDEKNKIAGQAQQKLPRLESTEEVSSAAAEKIEAKPVSGPLEQAREIIREILVTDWISQPAHVDAEHNLSMETISPANHAANQVERLGAMISSEVFTLRQTGANELGVSLKLDSQTEIFLGLTQHAGQIHASIRCERGDLSGLANHWAQLQESLARHNVQLAPMEKSSSSDNSTFNSPTNQSSQNFAQARQEQNRDQRLPEFSNDRTFVEPRARAKSSVKNVKNLNQGWESWA